MEGGFLPCINAGISAANFYELKTLKVGDKVTVQWGPQFPKMDGMVLELKEYASRWAVSVKTDKTFGEFVANQVELVERASDNKAIAKAVNEFIAKVTPLL